MKITLVCFLYKKNYFIFDYFIFKMLSKVPGMYTIRLKFSNYFVHHYFENRMFENFRYDFNIKVMLKFMLQDEFERYSNAQVLLRYV